MCNFDEVANLEVNLMKPKPILGERRALKNNNKVSILLCRSFLSSSMNIERNAACWRRYGLIWYKLKIEPVEEIFFKVNLAAVF